MDETRIFLSLYALEIDLHMALVATFPEHWFSTKAVNPAE